MLLAESLRCLNDVRQELRYSPEISRISFYRHKIGKLLNALLTKEIQGQVFFCIFGYLLYHGFIFKDSFLKKRISQRVPKIVSLISPLPNIHFQRKLANDIVTAVTCTHLHPSNALNQKEM